MSYVTATEICQEGVDRGFLEELPIDFSPYDRLLPRAIAAWETATKWTPFLAPDEDAVIRMFNGSGSRLLHLRGGALSIERIAVNDVDLDASAWSINYSAKGPIRSVELACCPGSTDRVSVEAVWGYCTEVPDDVNEAIAAYVLTETVQAFGGGLGPLKMIKQGGRQLQAVDGKDAYTLLQEKWDDTVIDYKRRA